MVLCGSLNELDLNETNSRQIAAMDDCYSLAWHINRHHFFKFQASWEADSRATNDINGVLGSARWIVSIWKTVVHGSPARPTLAKFDLVNAKVVKVHMTALSLDSIQQP